MKKNAVGHMIATKEPVSAKIRHWNILPKLLCLLLALLIWLTVVNFEERNEDPSQTNSGVSDGSYEE